MVSTLLGGPTNSIRWLRDVHAAREPISAVGLDPWFPSALGVERLVVGDNASGLRWIERYGLEVFRWDARKNKVGVCAKTKPAVVLWFAQHYAARGSTVAKNAQSFAHEQRTNSTTLMLWQN